jgi:hypothetical protein
VASAALALGDRCATPSWKARVTSAAELLRQPPPGASRPGASADAARAPVADSSLCCGYGSAAELLLLAGDPLAARAAAAALIPPSGGDWALGSQPGVCSLLLGFHRGIAGLGYTFLRAAAPSQFPSVLTWG